jgi:hypothetical protein
MVHNNSGSYPARWFSQQRYIIRDKENERILPSYATRLQEAATLMTSVCIPGNYTYVNPNCAFVLLAVMHCFLTREFRRTFWIIKREISD